MRVTQMQGQPVSTAEAIAVLDLEEVAGGGFRGRNHGTGTGVVHGGPLMGQMLVAASRTLADKQVKSFHAVLARMVKPAHENEITVDVAHNGRMFGSASVDLRQEGKVNGRMLALFHQPEPDLIHLQPAMPAYPAPEDCAQSRYEQQTIPGELAIPPGQEVMDPEAVGPAEYALWFRCPEAPDDPVTQTALLIPPSVMFAIGAAVRPHRGLGLSMAHKTIDTGVVTQTITYHRRADVRRWLLYMVESTFAGAGRSFSRGQIFTREGRLVASFQQENIIRQMHEWSRVS